MFTRTREDGTDDDDTLAELLPAPDVDGTLGAAARDTGQDAADDNDSNTNDSGSGSSSSSNMGGNNKGLRIRHGRRGMFVANSMRACCSTPQEVHQRLATHTHVSFCLFAVYACVFFDALIHRQVLEYEILI